MRPLIGLALLVVCTGCDMRTLDPNWKAVWSHSRLGTTPGEYPSALFMYNETDEDLRRAVPYIRKVKLTELNLQDTKFTDAAVPELLKLETLERLEVGGGRSSARETRFTSASTSRSSGRRRSTRCGWRTPSDG